MNGLRFGRQPATAMTSYSRYSVLALPPVARCWRFRDRHSACVSRRLPLLRPRPLASRTTPRMLSSRAFARICTGPLSRRWITIQPTRDAPSAVSTLQRRHDAVRTAAWSKCPPGGSVSARQSQEEASPVSSLPLPRVLKRATTEVADLAASAPPSPPRYCVCQRCADGGHGAPL